MNTFGRIFRVSMLGESHGGCVGALLDGVPAGLALSAEDIIPDLARRKSGAKGTTARKEEDAPRIMSGVFDGMTTGAPVLILIDNKDVDSGRYLALKGTPRPGHADMAAWQKFGGFSDYRGGGHFSGRLTAALVCAGAVAKKMLAASGTSVEASVVEINGARDATGMDAEIEAAIKVGDSVGGIVECRAIGVPPGLGEPFFDSAESLLAHAALSIPAVKGIEFGAGFACSRMRGSACNDAILDASGHTATNNAGGINGGITNGNELVFRVAVKPTSSIAKEGKTVNLETGNRVPITVAGRHDACIALRVPVVLEAAAAIVLADLMLIEQKVPRVLGKEPDGGMRKKW
ncbi:chorismate synthase [Candidatus Micrarchaeota archaeon]|nr:chorismate synthase [Candidatus Micrarchaeota archaeon]